MNVSQDCLKHHAKHVWPVVFFYDLPTDDELNLILKITENLLIKISWYLQSKAEVKDRFLHCLSLLLSLLHLICKAYVSLSNQEVYTALVSFSSAMLHSLFVVVDSLQVAVLQTISGLEIPANHLILPWLENFVSFFNHLLVLFGNPILTLRTFILFISLFLLSFLFAFAIITAAWEAFASRVVGIISGFGLRILRPARFRAHSRNWVRVIANLYIIDRLSEEAGRLLVDYLLLRKRRRFRELVSKLGSFPADALFRAVLLLDVLGLELIVISVIIAI